MSPHGRPKGEYRRAKPEGTLMSEPQQTVGAAAAPVVARQAWYGLFLLWLVYVFANIDRFAIGIALQEIKKDLLLSDTQLGLISGSFFVVPYIVFGFPISRWLDRGVRRTILAWSVGLWSLMATATGAAVGFVQIGLARAGLGAG